MYLTHTERDIVRTAYMLYHRRMLTKNDAIRMIYKEARRNAFNTDAMLNALDKLFTEPAL